VQTYSKPSLHGDAGHLKDSTPPKTCRICSICCARSCRRAGPVAQGLLGPVVNDEFSDVDSILYMMTGDGADYVQLKKAAEGMRQRLLKVPGVTKVDLYGTQDERIFVEFSHAKLATLGITPQALFDSLRNKITLRRRARWKPPRSAYAAPSPARSTRKAVAETPVESKPGRVFRLGDIATVTHGFVDRQVCGAPRKASPRSALASSPPRRQHSGARQGVERPAPTS